MGERKTGEAKGEEQRGARGERKRGGRKRGSSSIKYELPPLFRPSFPSFFPSFSVLVSSIRPGVFSRAAGRGTIPSALTETDGLADLLQQERQKALPVGDDLRPADHAELDRATQIAAAHFVSVQLNPHHVESRLLSFGHAGVGRNV